MPDITPKYGFPFPLDNDPVHQGSKHIRDLAKMMESTLDKQGAQPAATSVVEISRRLLALEKATADSGWQPIPLAAGFAWRSGYEGRIRRRGPIVNVIGQLQTSQDAWNGAGVRLTLPAGFLPDGEQRVDQMVGSNWIAGWYRPNGALYTAAVSGSAYFIINAQFFLPVAT